jgi:hypothetical protein
MFSVKPFNKKDSGGLPKYLLIIGFHWLIGSASGLLMISVGFA